MNTSFNNVKWNHNWDERQHFSPSSSNADGSGKIYNKNAKPVRHILLVRHGDKCEGKVDEEKVLSELGKKQSLLTALRLKAEMNDEKNPVKFTSIAHSSMIRAEQTAKIISEHLPGLAVKSCDLLREGWPTIAEPPITRTQPESVYKADKDRAEAAFRKYFHRADKTQTEDSFDILVCHGNVIRYLLFRALQLPVKASFRLELYSCCVTWLTIAANGVVYAHYIGDTGHIPYELRSITH